MVLRGCVPAPLCSVTTRGRERLVPARGQGGSVQKARNNRQRRSHALGGVPLAALESKAVHDCACYRGGFITENAGFYLFSLVGIVYLGSTI